jgi:hypothetical protein
MNTEVENHLIPTHKILLVANTHIESLHPLFSSLEKEGIYSKIITVEDINKSDDVIEANFLWIHTPYLDNDILLATMKQIPELTGVLLCFDTQMSRLDMLRSISIARCHYVAIIGAVFLVESELDENYGVDICRRSGIPYLYSAIKDRGNRYLIDEHTIASLVEMSR